MENIKEVLEIIGNIEKKETLSTIGYDDLVLETLYPFPGYHGTTVPDRTQPRSVFFILKNPFSEEAIIRTTLRIKKNYFHYFDGTPGVVEVFNGKSPAIRIKGLADYRYIPELLEAYKNEGFEMMKGKKIEPYNGLIRLKKYFLLEYVAEGVYLDREIPVMGYFEIPVELTWEQFETITLDIKRNIKEKNWDAALGVFFRKKGVTDVVRIFKFNIDTRMCLYIKGKYLDAITKFLRARG